MSRLLHKPLKIFILFACLTLAASIPAYFFMVEAIWMDELDDHNELIKQQVQQGFSGMADEELERSIALWNRIHPESAIHPASRLNEDSVYIIEREVFDDGEVEKERFRGLSAGVELNHKPYLLHIETNVEEVDETILYIALITLGFVVLLVTGFVLLNKRISEKLWQPFADTLEKLRKFELDSTNPIEFSKTTIVEFNELNTVLKKLIEENIRIYNQQKEFVQNASHELQTPLALLTSRIDLLIQDTSLSETQRENIETLAESVSRVSRFNRNLLLLAGIENRTYSVQNVTVNDRVSFLSENLRELDGGKRHIELTPGDPITVSTNESLLDVLISNLLSNAFRHSDHDASITVAFHGPQLLISNSGDRPLNTEALFKRFQSASSDNPGTGLGLAIAKEICQKYGWRISYRFDDNRHRFVIDF